MKKNQHLFWNHQENFNKIGLKCPWLILFTKYVRQVCPPSNMAAMTKIEIFIFNISSETKLAWKDLGWSYLKNCVRSVHPPSNMTAIAKNRNIKIYIWWKIVYCMGLRVHKHSDVFHSYCLRFLGLFTGRLGLYSTAVYCVITSSIALLVRNETMSHLNLSRGFVFWFSRKNPRGTKRQIFLGFVTHLRQVITIINTNLKIKYGYL